MEAVVVKPVVCSILVFFSWSHSNIGDIGITPGMLHLLEEMDIHNDYDGALAQVKEAMEFVKRRQKETMAVVKATACGRGE